MPKQLEFFIELLNRQVISCNLWSEFSADDSIVEIDKVLAFENGEAPVQIKEGQSYEYALPQNYKFDYHELVKSSKSNSNCGRIVPNIYVGSLSLDIVYQGQKCGSLILEVRSVKTEYREDYRTMLEDITDRCTDLVLMHSSPVTQNLITDFNADPQTLYQRFAFIKSVLDADEFKDAMQKILSNPVTKWISQEVEKDIRSSKRFDNRTIRQLSGSSTRIYLPENNPLVRKGLLKSVPQKITGFDKKESIDTPENRFIKFALESFLELIGKILFFAKGYSRLTTEASLLEDHLSQLLNHSTFKDIYRLNSVPFNSPVLQRKEGYREIFRAWLMFDLAAKLIWKGGDDVYKAGKRDVATLYEYWLFFKLLDLLKQLFKIDSADLEQLIEFTNGDLSVRLRQGKHIAINGIYKNEIRNLRIQFSFNRTFTGKKAYPSEGSWTKNMRPDYTLSMWPEAITQEEAEKQEAIVHIHFDAKYKVDRLSDIMGKGIDYEQSETEIEEDLTQEKREFARENFKRVDLLKMHAYKDAIRRTGGAYVLYPGLNSQPYRTTGFHEILPGLGAFAIRPDKTNDGSLELKNFLNEVIAHFLNRASQREKSAYRTFDIHKNEPNSGLNEPLPETYGSNRSLPPDDIFVLIGFFQEKQREWIKKSGLYNTRTGSDRGSQRLDLRIATAKYILLHGLNETKQGKLYRITNLGLRIFSKQDMVKCKYPNPSRDFYLVYGIQPVSDIEFVNVSWDISKLESYQKGRNSPVPFTVSLSELMSTVIK